MLPNPDCSDEQIREFFGASADTPIISDGYIGEYAKKLYPACKFLIRKLIYNEGIFSCYVITSKTTFFRQNIREEKPTSIDFSYIYEKSYSLRKQVIFSKNGRVHRVGGPAILTYINDSLCEEKYCLKGNYHNIAGPAIRVYTNGKWINRFYVEGKDLSLSKYVDYLNKRQLYK